MDGPVRIAAELVPAAAATLNLAAALLWLAAVGAWAARFLPIYVHPRADGQPSQTEPSRDAGRRRREAIVLEAKANGGNVMTTYQWVSRPGRLPLVLAVAFVLATGACTNRDETSNVTPEGTGDRPPSLPVILPPERTSTDTNLGHPKSGAKLALKIPAEVRAKWKAAELSLVGNGKAPRTVRVPVGGNTAVGGTGLTLLVVALVPAFQSSGDAVTSASNRPDNPAVLVRLLDKDRTLTEGWVFQKYPDFNTFNSDRVQVRLAAIE